MTNNILLYNKGSSTTAKALANMLGLRARKVPRNRDVIKVRYGSSEYSLEDDTQFNHPSAISLVADSVAFSNLALENEIPATRYIPRNEFQNDTFPVLLRKKYHHGGLDIVVINNSDELAQARLSYPEHYFVVPYVETSFELRIHVLGNAIAKTFKKIEGELTTGLPIRSSYKGWHYERLAENSVPKAKELALRAIEITGLSFGAVDMGWNPTSRSYTIFEINSAPGLNSVTLELYANYLRENL